MWSRPSIFQRWNHVRRVQALVDQWFDAVSAGKVDDIRALYSPARFRGVREESPAAPVTDVAAWLALRAKERQSGRVLDGGHRVTLSPSDIDGDKVWVSFIENVTTVHLRERRRRRFLFEGIAAPLITAEWEGAVEPGWRDSPPRAEIPIAARAPECPLALALGDAPYWLVAAEENTHAAALARVAVLRASGRAGEVVLATPLGVVPAKFLIVSGVARDRGTAEAEAARAGARVMESGRLPALEAVGRGAPLRLTGQIAFRSEALMLVIGRSFFVGAFVLNRYRLDDGKLTLVAQYDFEVIDARLGERNGAPCMKTKSGGWVRINPETGALAPLGDGAPPPVAGGEVVVGERRFSAEPARRGFAITRGSAPEAFVPLDTAPSLFVATPPEGQRLVVWRNANVPTLLFEITAEPPAAGVAKLCGEMVWYWGKGIPSSRSPWPRHPCRPARTAPSSSGCRRTG